MEQLNDLGDVGDFEEPPEYFLVKVHVPDDAIKNRDAWKYDGKVVKVRRRHKYPDQLVTVSDIMTTAPVVHIPSEWCTPAESFFESKEFGDVGDFADDLGGLGDVGDFERPRGNLYRIIYNNGLGRKCAFVSARDRDKAEEIIENDLGLISSYILSVEDWFGAAPDGVILHEAFNPIAYFTGESEGPTSDEAILRLYSALVARKQRARGTDVVAEALIEVAKKFGLKLKAVWDSLQTALNQQEELRTEIDGNRSAEGVFEESTTDMPLSTWNDDQKQLWLSLVKDGAVARNDPTAFYTFGKYFDDYYHKTGEVVPYSKLRAHFGLKEGIDDFGDVGDFDRGSSPEDLLNELWQEFGGEGDEQEVYAFVHEAKDAGFSVEEIKDTLRAIFFQPGSEVDENTLKSWLGESVDDFGDVGDFEEPASHRHAIIDYMEEPAGKEAKKATSLEIVDYYFDVGEQAEKAEEGIKRVLQRFHISLLDFITALETEYAEGPYVGYEHLEFMIETLKELYQLQEGVDFGDVGDYEESYPPQGSIIDEYLTAREQHHDVPEAVGILKNMKVSIDDIIAALQSLIDDDGFNGGVQLEIDDLEAFKNGTYRDTSNDVLTAEDEDAMMDAMTRHEFLAGHEWHESVDDQLFK